MTDEHITTYIEPPNIPTTRCVMCATVLPLHEAWRVFINRRTAITETQRRWRAWHTSNPEDLWQISESYWNPGMTVTANWSGEIPACNPTHITYTYTGHACCEEHAKQGETLTPWEENPC